VSSGPKPGSFKTGAWFAMVMKTSVVRMIITTVSVTTQAFTILQIPKIKGEYKYISRTKEKEKGSIWKKRAHVRKI
jgi:hypothetical protein